MFRIGQTKDVGGYECSYLFVVDRGTQFTTCRRTYDDNFDNDFLRCQTGFLFKG